MSGPVLHDGKCEQEWHGVPVGPCRCEVRAVIAERDALRLEVDRMLRVLQSITANNW